MVSCASSLNIFFLIAELFPSVWLYHRFLPRNGLTGMGLFQFGQWHVSFCLVWPCPENIQSCNFSPERYQAQSIGGRGEPEHISFVKKSFSCNPTGVDGLGAEQLGETCSRQRHCVPSPEAHQVKTHSRNQNSQ